MGDVDLYCERLGPGLLAEPVNALTNLAFFVAAWALWRQGTRARRPSDARRWLVGLMVAIGLGSTLFHTVAQTWTRVLDVVPILLFQLVFVWLYVRRVIGWPTAPAAGLLAAFLAAALYGLQFPHLLGGSLIYAPAIVLLLGLAWFHWRTHQPGPGLLPAAAGVFAVALFFRTIDGAACAQFPLGTHFVWHLLTPVVLYLSVRTLRP